MLSFIGKLMPYFIIIKYVKKFCPQVLECKELGKCRGFRLGKGEWIIYSEENYKAIQQNIKLSEEIDKQIREEEERKQFEKLKQKFLNLGEKEE